VQQFQQHWMTQQ